MIEASNAYASTTSTRLVVSASTACNSVGSVASYTRLVEIPPYGSLNWKVFALFATCPAGTVVDPVTKKCVEPCMTKQGDSTTIAWLAGRRTQRDVPLPTITNAPSSYCDGTCVASDSGGSSGLGCTIGDGQYNVPVICTAPATFTGASCSVSDFPNPAPGSNTAPSDGGGAGSGSGAASEQTLASVASNTSATSSKLDSTNSSLSSLLGSLSTLISEATATKNAVTTSGENLQNIDTNSLATATNSGSIIGQLNSLLTAAANTVSALTGIQTSVTTQNTKADITNQSLGLTNTALDTINTTINNSTSTSTTQNNTIIERLGATESKLGSLEGKLDSLNNNATGIKNAIDQNTTANTTQTNAINSNISTLNNNIGLLDTKAGEGNSHLEKIKEETTSSADALLGRGSGAGSTTSLDGQRTAFEAANDALKEALVTNAVTEAPPTGWTWLPSFGSSSCAPWLIPRGNGATVSIDPCPAAQRIREAGAYILYFLTAFGLFVILTGKKET